MHTPGDAGATSKAAARLAVGHAGLRKHARLARRDSCFSRRLLKIRPQARCASRGSCMRVRSRAPSCAAAEPRGRCACNLAPVAALPPVHTRIDALYGLPHTHTWLLRTVTRTHHHLTRRLIATRTPCAPACARSMRSTGCLAPPATPSGRPSWRARWVFALCLKGWPACGQL